MPNSVTLTPAQARNALNTLTYADSVLSSIGTWPNITGGLRAELLELRREIARQYNASREEQNNG